MLSLTFFSLPLFLSSFRTEFPKITPKQSISDYLGYLNSLASYVAALTRENLQKVQQGHSLSTSREIKSKEKEVMSGGESPQHRGRGRPPKSQTNQTTSPGRELRDKRAAESLEDEEDGGGTSDGKRQKMPEPLRPPPSQAPIPSAGSSSTTSPTPLPPTSTGGAHPVVPSTTLYIPTKEEKARLLQDLGSRKSTISNEFLFLFLLLKKSIILSCFSFLVDQLTKCPICHNTLTSPRTLPCLHSFCLTCLEQQQAGLRLSSLLLFSFLSFPFFFFFFFFFPLPLSHLFF